MNEYKAATLAIARRAQQISETLLVHISGKRVYNDLEFEEDQKEHRAAVQQKLVCIHEESIAIMRQTYEVFKHDGPEVRRPGGDSVRYSGTSVHVRRAVDTKSHGRALGVEFLSGQQRALLLPLTWLQGTLWNGGPPECHALSVRATGISRPCMPAGTMQEGVFLRCRDVLKPSETKLNFAVGRTP